MSNDYKADIVVIGGGLSGLLAAARLAKPDRSVALLAPPRPPDNRTTALLGSSVEALVDLGVWDSLAAGGEPLRAIRIIDDSTGLIKAPEVLFAAEDVGEELLGINVANEPLLTALEHECIRSGVNIIPAKAAALSLAPDRATITLDNGNTVTAALAIAADGRGSAMRQAASIAIDIEQLPQSALVCNVRHQRDHHGITNEFHTDRGPFTFVPLADRESGLIWVEEPDEAARLSQLPTAELASAIERKSQSILGRIEISSRVQVFPLATGIARRFAAGRLVVTGEAAHVLPPIAAQGFNLTVRDIEALVEIADNTDDCGSPEAVAEYRRRREADAKFTVEAVRMVNGMLLSSTLPTQLARTAGMLALTHVAPLKRFLIRQGLSRR